MYSTWLVKLLSDYTYLFTNEHCFTRLVPSAVQSHCSVHIKFTIFCLHKLSAKAEPDKLVHHHDPTFVIIMCVHFSSDDPRTNTLLIKNIYNQLVPNRLRQHKSYW